jgi:hypothetical protein
MRRKLNAKQSILTLRVQELSIDLCRGYKNSWDNLVGVGKVSLDWEGKYHAINKNDKPYKSINIHFDMWLHAWR